MQICPKTSYPELPQIEVPPATLLNSIYAANKLLELTDPETAKATFIILGAEASKKGDKSNPLSYSFRSAGGHNYSGTQTDSGRWTNGNFLARFCRKDVSGKLREFAAFKGDDEFLAFMASRVKAKGFQGSNADEWTERYLNNWVEKNMQGRDLAKYNQMFPQKKAMHQTYAPLFDRVTSGSNLTAYRSGAVTKSVDTPYNFQKKNSSTPLFAGVPGVLAYLSIAGLIFFFFKRKKKS